MTARATPIFVFGASRSGTTMLGALLGRHPDCHFVPEMQFVTEALRHFHPVEEADARELLRFVAASPRHRLWESPLDAEAVPDEALPRDLAGVIELVVRNHATVHGRAAPLRHWIDHTPLSGRYAAHLARHFPGARFVHIVRDGRAVAASVRGLDWGPNNVFEAARVWLVNLAYGFAAEEHLGPDRALRVRYEDVLTAPHATLERLGGFLGLDLHPSSAERQREVDLPAYTREQHALVNGPLDTSRVDAWRRELSPRDVEQIESIAAEMLEHLGYAPVSGLRARPLTRREQRSNALRGLWLREVVNPWRRSRRWRR